MKIALGITTVEERTLPSSVVANTECLIHVHTDTERIGVAKSRNNAIKYLYDKGFDYIAIMDDDVQILYKGWEKYIVEAMRSASVDMVGLPNSFLSKHIKTIGEMSYWSDSIGAFHVFSRRFIDKVGYFCTAFGRYGFEDSHMQYRYKKYYRTDAIPSPLRAPYYFHSEDVYNMNPTPSFSCDQKTAEIARNRPIFENEVKIGRIYYPYEQ